MQKPNASVYHYDAMRDLLHGTRNAACLILAASLTVLLACASAADTAVDGPDSAPDWHYVCYDGAERSVAEALGTGEVQAVYRLNAYQTFDRWFAGRPDLSTITTVHTYEPLFVLATADVTWQPAGGIPPSTVNLAPGWNAVCYSGTTRSAAEATSSISEHLAVLYSLTGDGAWQRFAPGRPEVSNLVELHSADALLLLATGSAGTVWAFPQDDAFAWPDWARRARIAGAFFEPGDSDDDIEGTLDDLASQGASVVLADSPWGSSYSASVDDVEFLAVKETVSTVVEKAHERGLKVVLYQTGLELIADPPRNPGSEHPDWPQVSLDGRPVLFSDISSEQEHWLDEGQSDVWLSPCSGYRQLSLTRVREMAGAGIDGLWVDTVYLQHSIGEHEDLWPSTDTCSAAAFQSATGLSMPTAEDWNDPTWRRWVVWRHEQMVDYLLAVKQTARDVNADLVFFEENWNLDGGGATQYANDPAAYLHHPDMSTGHEVSTIGDRVDEGETGMQDATLDQWLAFVAMVKWARGADAGKPSWVLTYGYQPGDAEQLAGVILAEGANYYETRGPSMDGSVGADYRQRIFGWTADHQEALYGGESAATVALAYSPRTRDLFDQGAGDLYAPEDAPFFHEYRRAAATLLRHHIPFDIVILDETVPADSLAGYGTLILPNIAAMSDAEAAAVRDFAGGGRKVIRIGETGSRNEWLIPRAADPLAGVQSIFIDTVTTDGGAEALALAANAAQIETNLTPWVQAGFRQTKGGLQLVLVNLGQDPVGNAEFSVRLPQGAQVQSVSATSPGDEAVSIEYSEESGYLRLALADLPVLTLVEVRLG